MKSEIIFTLLMLVTFITFNSCRHNPVSPANPGSDYIWEMDTIKTIDPLTLSRIWAISPNDVWAVGSGAATALGIWHYDGKRWGCDSISRGFTPWAIIGFSSDQVWIGNASSSIWEYNGSRWQQYGEYHVEGYDQVVIQNFDGLSGNDIYAVGFAEVLDSSNTYKGIVMHYDGSSWNMSNIPSVKVGFADGKIDQKSGALIIEGTVYDPAGWINKIYSWDGNQLKGIYSSISYGSVGSVNHEVLVTIAQKLYKYENGQLVLWKNLSGTEYTGKVWCGRSENDFFMGTLSGSGGIGHYNGAGFKILYNFKTPLDIYDACILNKDVFFLLKAVNGTGDNFILHGRLK